MAVAVAANLAVEHFRLWTRQLILDTGEPLELEAFQLDFITDVFDGFPECWLVVPEENGKTTLVAALALYHAEHRRLASVLVAASSRDQGELIYRQAEGFVHRSPALHAFVHSELQAVKGRRTTTVPRFVCREGYRRINHFKGGRIQVFAADDGTGDGQLPTLAIPEELHRHRDLRLYRTWSGKLRKRGGQIVAISTAGEPGSEFEETRNRIRQAATEITRQGAFVRAVAGSVVLHEYAVPEDADVTDMTIVKGANPFSRVTEQRLRAKHASPTMTHAYWLRFVCNLPTRDEDAAITEAEWERAKTATPIPAGERIWLGLDVAWKWDTTAAVPFWIPEPERRIFGPAAIVTPPRDGNQLHPDAIKQPIRDIHAVNPIDTVVMDTSDAHDIAAWIEDEIGATVIERQQTIPLKVAEFDAFMEALRNGWLQHSGDEGLTRHAMNAVARLGPKGDRYFDRRSSVRRSSKQALQVIDGLTAASMVHAQATLVDDTPSVYEERELVAV